MPPPSTAFLSHSSLDRQLAYGLQQEFAAQGWYVYIDWQDPQMPEQASKRTADIIRIRIEQTDWLIYLATGNTQRSRWCPWEIGYADGVKPKEKIVIVPTIDAAGHTHGAEYLDLYPHIEMEPLGRYVLQGPGAARSQPINQL